MKTTIKGKVKIIETSKFVVVITNDQVEATKTLSQYPNFACKLKLKNWILNYIYKK